MDECTTNNVGVVCRETRGGPCWLMKLRWMGTQRVQMTGVLPWLVRRARRAGTQELFILLLWSAQYKIFSYSPYTISNICVPIAPWAGSRAGPPVSDWLRLLDTPFKSYRKLRAGIFKLFKESMVARDRGGIGLSYRPARLHRLAEFIPWNRFLGSRNV